MMSINGQGQVITFYSYKGGTGRTMALANVACLLAKRQVRGRGVLMIDWDLEAPGLHRFFRDRFKLRFADADDPDRYLDKQPGLLDLFLELEAATRETTYQAEETASALFENVKLERFILETNIPSLHLLKAGRFDENYASRVNTFQWEELYNRVPWLIRSFAERLTTQYQYVLIDSRTGITDISGICTMLMPEKLVVVFTPNRQSLTGVLELVRRATNYRRQSDDLRPLVVFPLPSRIEATEPTLYDDWRYGNSQEKVIGYQPQFEELFEDVYDLAECKLDTYFAEVQIQHIPPYAYGEKIAVLVERGKDRLSLTRSYESFTEGLCELAGPWEDWDLVATRHPEEILEEKEFPHLVENFLIMERRAGRLLSTVDDLYRAFLKSKDAPDEVDGLRAEFETAIGRVESRNLIRRLNFGDLVLLQPELLDAYASAMVNAAKKEPDGLGCIAEEDALAGRFQMAKDERIRDKNQEKLLLIATVEELLCHEIALREQTEVGPILVFPSQFAHEAWPDTPDPKGKTVIFEFEGPVLDIYATLAVRLSRSGFFRKEKMWKNAAVYTANVGGGCGVWLREIEEGRGELTLFFDTAANEATRYQFEEYVRTHLGRRALPDSIHRRRIFVCPECGTPVTDLQAERRRERGFNWISCGVCDTQVSLLDRKERLAVVHPSAIAEMDRAADAGRERDAAIAILQGRIATGDFDVFLCHNSEDKPMVKKIGESLKEQGILPWLDEWELRPGLPWQRLLEEQIAQIKSAAVFVGKEGIGPWKQLEVEAFLRKFVDRGCPVIPVLLPDAPRMPKLPIFLRGMTWVDFRKRDPDPMEQLIWGITGKRAWLDS